MNGRKAKQIRKKALHLIVEWLQLQLPENEAKKLNIHNVQYVLPIDKYIYANHKIMLSSYSFKWIIKKIKNLKNKRIQDISLKDIDNISNKETSQWKKKTNYL
jgi:ribosomal protein S7